MGTSDWCDYVDEGVAVVPKNADKIPDNAFAYCAGPFSIMIPASVKTIGAGAFLKSGLTSIKFLGDDDSLLEEIEDAAFKGCRSLESVLLPASVKTIGYKAFLGSGLTS